MATVYKRGSTYWIRFTWRGQEVRKSAKTTSKTVAMQFLAQTMEERRKLDRGGRPRHTYKETLERYRVEVLPSLKANTRSRYATSLAALAPSFGTLYLDEITKSRLAEFVSARRRQGVTGATIRRDLSALSATCTFAVAADMFEANPVRAYDKRHIKDSPVRTTYPTDAEIEHLIRSAAPTMGRIIRFLAETGMRQEEAVSLEWSQVSLDRREVRLTKTKTSSPRVVPLSDAALSTLINAPRHPTSPYVFWHSNGGRYIQFSSNFGSLARRIGFKFRCHDLRHRFASVFLMETQDLAALKAVLGHKSIEMTMRYSHLLTDHLHAAVARAGTKLGTRTQVPAQNGHRGTLPTAEPRAGIDHCWTATARYAPTIDAPNRSRPNRLPSPE